MTKYGLAGTGATVAARILSSHGLLLVLTNQPFGDDCIRWTVPQDFEPDDDYGSDALPKLSPHFPYGYDVEPNVPV